MGGPLEDDWGQIVNERGTDGIAFKSSILNGQGISEGRVLVAGCRAAQIPIERGW